MSQVERELVTRKYPSPDRPRSEVTLILGPMFFMVFVKPFCYLSMFNCMFGIGKTTAADEAAVSGDNENPYEHNSQVSVWVGESVS